MEVTPQAAAKHTGRFVLGVGAGGAVVQAHPFRWDGGFRRPGKGGVFGWVVHEKTFPPDKALPPKGWRRSCGAAAAFARLAVCGIRQSIPGWGGQR